MDDGERRRLLDEALYALERAARAVEALREDVETPLEEAAVREERAPSLAQQVLRRLSAPRLRSEPTGEEREERERMRAAAERHRVDDRVLFALTKPPSERNAIERARLESAAKQVAYEQQGSLFDRARLAAREAGVVIHVDPETVPLAELDDGEGWVDEDGPDELTEDDLNEADGLPAELVDGAAVGGALEQAPDPRPTEPTDPPRDEPAG